MTWETEAADAVPDMGPLLEVDSLEMKFSSGSKFFGTQRQTYAVNGVSFEIFPGEAYGLVGESGCGKSTTGRLVQQILAPTGGSVRYKGVELGGLSQDGRKKFARAVQTVLQDPYGALNPRFKIATSMNEVLKIHKIGTASERRDRIARALATVGLDEELGQRFPHEFSGGQRQRIGIARALLVAPKLLICDEPVSALDVSVQAQILNLLKSLQREHNMSYLFISHDLSVVKYVSHRVGVMYLGTLVEEAPTSDLYSDPLHPYTQALLRSVPVNHPNKRGSRSILAGNVPNQNELTSGCVFRTRCPLAADICHERSPEFRTVKAGHKVACHMVDAVSTTGPATRTPSPNPASTKEW